MKLDHRDVLLATSTVRLVLREVSGNGGREHIVPERHWVVRRNVAWCRHLDRSDTFVEEGIEDRDLTRTRSVHGDATERSSVIERSSANLLKKATDLS